MEQWKFWIDVGGTFTDCLALTPQGRELSLKVLSSGILKGAGFVISSDSITLSEPNEFLSSILVGSKIKFVDSDQATITQSKIQKLDSENLLLKLTTPIFDKTGQDVRFEIEPDVPSPVLAIRLATKTPLLNPLDPCEVYLGTTKSTNALLTRNGAKTGLVTSSGMKDFLLIGDQTRPKLFELNVVKAEPLFSEAIEIGERILFDGTVEQEPDPVDVRNKLVQLRKQGIESIAICLMHSYKFPAHEKIVGEIANGIGFEDVRLSSQVAPLIEIVPRGETTVLDAYLNLVIAEYLDDIQVRLGTASKLKLITSAGTLTARELFSGKDSVLSGPAGGVVGAARIAQQVGFENALGFDMGGTSTDVSRFDGEFQLEYETRKAGVRIMTPVMSIETVAAGGGSVCHFDGTRLLVGPDSAGASPGPACYGAGGPLTVTDINLFLGRLDTGLFPFQLDFAAVETRLAEIATELFQAGMKKSLNEIANGFLRIANHSMSLAIQSVSTARGYDPRQYLLVGFGGAAGQHCCAVAEYLGIKQILIHPRSSILSAQGIQLSDQSHFESRSVAIPVDDQAIAKIESAAGDLEENMRRKMNQAGILVEQLDRQVTVDLRYTGTDNAININLNAGQLYKAFSEKHKLLFGYVQQRPIEAVAVRVKLSIPGKRLLPSLTDDHKTIPAISSDFKLVDFEGAPRQTAVFVWDELIPGNLIEGPAIVSSRLTSTIIDAGWNASVLGDKQLLLTQQTTTDSALRADLEFAVADPIELEIFNNVFQTIAEQMGQILRLTAISVNVKQRLDYSCAIFDEEGNLVVNAPHIPVHLGAMSETVKATIRLNNKIYDGDVFVANDPYAGGSHLPDVTVLTPVFNDSDAPMFWVASRAHHAEIGGSAPGSMPASARVLGEEGVIIRNFRLVHQGQSNFDGLEQLLTHSPYPSRTPKENLADIKAQVAANQAGVQALGELIREHTRPKVNAYMKHIQAAAAAKAQAYIKSIPNGVYEFEDSMDDGTAVKVRIVVENEQLEIDFSESGDVHPGNLNANTAIVSSAIMYVLRCLIAEDIPLNSGILNSVKIKLAPGFLNPPALDPHENSPAVVGGNVETSQRVVDVLFGAFGIAAASQGTMNNWLVGNEEFGYYETVGGGGGATLSGHGADGIHCHMSNTKLTDPEILETRYPMILREFSIRRKSGGDGKFCGGCGMIREVEFTSPLTLSVLSSRRTTQPFGIEGGEPGSSGENRFIHKDGSVEKLSSQCQKKVCSGDRLRLQTPGGGGAGKRPSD